MKIENCLQIALKSAILPQPLKSKKGKILQVISDQKMPKLDKSMHSGIFRGFLF